MTRQKQKGGDRSTNIQGEKITVHQHGISVADAHAIALSVFQANFYDLADLAKTVAEKRAEEITEKFLKKLEQNNPVGLEQAQDPDFQVSLFTVQKEYARTGDKELGDLLVDLLVDRTKEKERSIKQIVLNESLLVAPKLTIDQLAALSVIFIIRYSVNKVINSLDSFNQYIDMLILPFASLINKKSSCYQHLQYAGCGSISMGSLNLVEVFRKNYYGLFSKGFEPEKLKERELTIPIDSPIFTQCLHAADKLQLNGMTEDQIKEKATKLEIIQEDIKKLIKISKGHLMSNDEIKEYLISARPYMSDVIDVWQNSPMKNFMLTSVGIAIGHANVKKSTGELTDLSIWIS